MMLHIRRFLYGLGVTCVVLIFGLAMGMFARWEYSGYAFGAVASGFIIYGAGAAWLPKRWRR